MNTPSIVAPAVVAGLAVAAALVTASFIRAAEGAAGVANPAVSCTGQPNQPIPTDTHFPFVVGGPNFVAAFTPLDGQLRMRSFVSGLDQPNEATAGALSRGLAPIDAVAPLGTVDGTPRDFPKEKTAEGRALEPSRAMPAKSAAAVEAAARDEAELQAMFAVAVRVNPARAAAAKSAQGERGKAVYLSVCYACHQLDGRGLPGAFPALAKSDFMAADRTRAIRVVLEGLEGPVTVNGQTLNSAMPAQKAALTDEQIADVLTYIFDVWENPGGTFTTKQVEAIRNKNTRIGRE
jgi:mono/diheme cytochrome c family protein